MTRTEIKISGYGGQGVITLGMLIANTVTLYMDNLVASQSESYGAAARGGSCWTEVVLDNEMDEIDYPRAIPGNVDVGIFLSDDAVSKYLSEVKKADGIIIYDPTSISKIRAKGGQKLYGVPVQQLARENFDNPLTANIIMFGALIGLTNLLEKDAALKSVKDSVPPKFLDINIKAFHLGFEYAQKLKNAA